MVLCDYSSIILYLYVIHIKFMYLSIDHIIAYQTILMVNKFQRKIKASA